MTFSDADLDAPEATALADSFRLSSLRLRLLAQPQVQREWRKLANFRASGSADYAGACQRLAAKLRGFFTLAEIDEKAEMLASGRRTEAWIWGTLSVRDTKPPRPRVRAPRQTGAPFRKVIDEKRGIWVDERIESAAKHIAAGLDLRAVADGGDKADGAIQRQQIKRLRELLPE